MTHTTQRFIIVALLLLVAVLSVQTCAKKQDQVNSLQKASIIQSDSLKHYHDKAGSEHAKKTMAEAEIALLKSIYRQQIDSLTRRLDIASSQLQSVTSISTKTEGKVVPIIDTFLQTDSTKEFDFHYADKWLTLKGRVGNNSYIDYSLRDSLIATVYFKKKSLFGKKQLMLDAFSMNPNVSVTGLTGYKVPYKIPGRWGIGPYVGLSYFERRFQPSFGVSLQYSFIRF